MRPLLTPTAMREADAATIAAGTPGEMLMERAGRAVARTAIRLAGGRYGRRIAVVCGPGNNGGDGFVAARVLRNEGVAVHCSLVGDPGSVKGDAAVHRDRWLRSGGTLRGFDAGYLSDQDVIVDALFGTGFHGRAEGDAADAIDAINRSSAAVIAIDVPSGVDALTGRSEGPTVRADVTVAMAAEKIGTAVGTGAVRSGIVEVIDIGIAFGKGTAFMTEGNDARGALPTRSPDAHKRSAGSVALLCGSATMSGAAILAARGAVRMGAGYATLGIPAAIEPIVAATLPEVLTAVVTNEPHLGPDALTTFKPVLDRADALGVGSGIGSGTAQRELVHAVLREVHQPVVLDADALNVLAGDLGPLASRSDTTVITPHPAELARLLATQTSAVQADRVEAAREAARRAGCVVVLKGFRSIVAAPDGTIVVNPTGSSELATAGTGDVLTGALTTLLAAGCDPLVAASTAVYVHGLAGELAAIDRGSGVVAWDVAESLASAVANLRTGS